MIQAITVKHHNKIKKAFVPLFKFLNLNEFWYYKIWDSGDKVYFGSNPEWSEFYVSNHYNFDSPVNCHPKFYRSGTFTFTTVKSFAEAQSLPEAKKRFNIHPNLLVINKLEEAMEGFGFSSPSPENKQVELLLSELPLLKLFFKKFREQNSPLFSELEENKINLKKMLGSKFFENRFLPDSNREQRIALLKSLGLSNFESLTDREIDVCKRLMRGFSAGQIAIQIQASKRTVEHRIERIKEKLNCYSKSELVGMIIEADQLGCLNLNLRGEL